MTGCRSNTRRSVNSEGEPERRDGVERGRPVRAEPVRVLHVDDEAAFTDIVTAMLEDERGRFDVETTTDPETAATRLTDADPGVDCVVSDYEMPRMDGLELLRAVRADHPDLPFVFFTGKGSEEIAAEAIVAGVTDYVRKGGGRDRYTRLANRVERAVARYRADSELAASRHLRESILAAPPVGVVVHDTDGGVVLANDHARSVLGADDTDLDASNYDRSGWALFTTDGDPLDRTALPYRRVVEDGPLRDQEYLFESDDGTRCQIIVHGAPLFDTGGVVEGAVVTFETRG